MEGRGAMMRSELKPPAAGRPRVDGKFLSIDGQRFLIKGVAYGTFAPDESGAQFPRPERIRQDFGLMAAAGINTVRTYTAPSPVLLDTAAEHLKAGAAILMFPEGTRSTKDSIARFKTGAFRLAKLGDIEILPVGISGTRYVLPKHGRLIKRHRVSVHIAPPLSAAEVRDTPLNQLSERTRVLLSELSGLPLAGDTGSEPEAVPTA